MDTKERVTEVISAKVNLAHDISWRRCFGGRRDRKQNDFGADKLSGRWICPEGLWPQISLGTNTCVQVLFGARQIGCR